MSARKAFVSMVVFLVLSLGWALWFPAIGTFVYREIGPEPMVPYVARQSSGETDFMSSVSGLITVLGGVLIAWALVEIAKGVLVASDWQNKRKIGLFAAMLLYQTALGMEMVRISAPDWWLWLKSLIGLYELTNEVTAPTPEQAIPWVSAALFAVISGIVVAEIRRIRSTAV
jgi:hypothetical protein